MSAVYAGISIWGVVKFVVLYWVLITTWTLISRAPKKSPHLPYGSVSFQGRLHQASNSFGCDDAKTFLNIDLYNMTLHGSEKRDPHNPSVVLVNPRILHEIYTKITNLKPKSTLTP